MAVWAGRTTLNVGDPGSRDNWRVQRDALDVNRAWWDGAASVHGSDPVYDTEALIRGVDWLGEEERAALAASVGSVSGLDVIHVQCHIGFDTISLARRGARVVGLDFSPAALAKAQQLARRANVEASWVQADAARIPADLHGRFDLAYATIGAICWIEDISAWMGSIAQRRCAQGDALCLWRSIRCSRWSPNARDSRWTSPMRLTGRGTLTSPARMPTRMPSFRPARPSTLPIALGDGTRGDRSGLAHRLAHRAPGYKQVASSTDRPARGRRALPVTPRPTASPDPVHAAGDQARPMTPELDKAAESG